MPLKNRDFDIFVEVNEKNTAVFFSVFCDRFIIAFFQTKNTDIECR